MNGIKKILKFDKLEKSKIDILLKFFSVTSITILSKIIYENTLWNLTNVFKHEASIFKLAQVVIISILILTFNRNFNNDMNKIKKNLSTSIIFLMAIFLIFGGEAGRLLWRFFNSSLTSVENNIWYTILLSLNLFIFYLNQELKTNIINKNTLTEVELFPERIKDLERLEYLIKNNNIVGIDDFRGSGKSTLVNKFLDKKNDMELIKIKLLNLGEKEISEVIFKELGIILSRNNNMLQNKNVAKNIIKDQSIAGFNLNSFINQDTISEKIEKFKQEIKSISKEVYIIIDDLDRTSDTEKIKNTLNIIGDLSEGVQNLKFIILYSQKDLLEIDNGLNRWYLEKYIPTFFNLSKFSFKELIEKLIKDRNLNIKDFDYLIAFYEKNPNIYKYQEYKGNLNKGLSYFQTLFSKEINMRNNFLTIRMVNNFLNEVEDYLMLIGKETALEKRAIISYFYIKNFMYKQYENLSKIESDESLEDIFQVEIDISEKKFKLIDILLLDYLLIKAVNIETIEENFQIFRGILVNVIEINEICLKILGEKLFLKENEYDKTYQRNESISELRLNLHKKLSKIKMSEETKSNLMIYLLFDYYYFDWNNISENIRYNENTMYTIKKLNRWAEKDESPIIMLIEEIKKMLEIKSLKDKKEKYNDLKINMYHGDLKNISYIGGNEWKELIREFNPNKENEYYKSSIELMFYCEPVINNKILEVLSDKKLYSDNKELWLFTLNEIGIKDFNENLYKPSVREVIKNLLIGVIQFRYIEENDINLYYLKSIEELKDIIKNITNELNRIYGEKISERKLKKEIEILNNFLQKSQNILNQQLSESKESDFKIDFKIKDTGTERIKKLEKLKSKGNLNLDKLYSTGEITPLEYINLLNSGIEIISDK